MICAYLLIVFRDFSSVPYGWFSLLRRAALPVIDRRFVLLLRDFKYMRLAWDFLAALLALIGSIMLG